MNIERMKDRMKELGMSRAQLIQASGVSESTMRRIFRGCLDVRISTVRMIADALEMDFNDLIDAGKAVPTVFDPKQVAEVSDVAVEALALAAEGQTVIIKTDDNDGSNAGNNCANAENGTPSKVTPPDDAHEIVVSPGDVMDAMAQVNESYKERLVDYDQSRTLWKRIAAILAICCCLFGASTITLSIAIVKLLG